jgi:hypothetical protein
VNNIPTYFLALVHWFPYCTEGFNINVIIGSFGLGESKAPTLYTGETVLSQYCYGLIHVINQEVHMMESLTMLCQEILINRVALNELA